MTQIVEIVGSGMWYAPDIVQARLVDEELAEKIKGWVKTNERVYIGEMAGKHSEVEFYWGDKSTSVKFHDDELYVDAFEQLFPNGIQSIDLIGDTLEQEDD